MKWGETTRRGFALHLWILLFMGIQVSIIRGSAHNSTDTKGGESPSSPELSVKTSELTKIFDDYSNKLKKLDEKLGDKKLSDKDKKQILKDMEETLKELEKLHNAIELASDKVSDEDRKTFDEMAKKVSNLINTFQKEKDLNEKITNLSESLKELRDRKAPLRAEDKLKLEQLKKDIKNTKDELLKETKKETNPDELRQRIAQNSKSVEQILKQHEKDIENLLQQQTNNPDTVAESTGSKTSTTKENQITSSSPKTEETHTATREDSNSLISGGNSYETKRPVQDSPMRSGGYPTISTPSASASSFSSNRQDPGPLATVERSAETQTELPIKTTTRSPASLPAQTLGETKIKDPVQNPSSLGLVSSGTAVQPTNPPTDTSIVRNLGQRTPASILSTTTVESSPQSTGLKSSDNATTDVLANRDLASPKLFPTKTIEQENKFLPSQAKESLNSEPARLQKLVSSSESGMGTSLLNISQQAPSKPPEDRGLPMSESNVSPKMETGSTNAPKEEARFVRAILAEATFPTKSNSILTFLNPIGAKPIPHRTTPSAKSHPTQGSTFFSRLFSYLGI